MSLDTEPRSHSGDGSDLKWWHEWQIDGRERRIILCVETIVELQPGNAGFDPIALDRLVERVSEMMKASPSPIDTVRIVPRR